MRHIPEELTPDTVARYFVRSHDNTGIRLTTAGKDRFREDFARVGYRVEDIKTVQQFFAAHNAYLTTHFDRIVSDSKTEPAVVTLLTQ